MKHEAEKWKLPENKKKQVEDTEMDALTRSAGLYLYILYIIHFLPINHRKPKTTMSNVSDLNYNCRIFMGI